MSQSDPAIEWREAHMFGVHGKAWSDTEAPYDRLPAKAHGLVPQSVWNLSKHCAGMHVRFRTDADDIHVRWQPRNDALAMHHMPSTGVSGLDLYGRDPGEPWRYLGNASPKTKPCDHTFKIDDGRCAEYLIYLPLYNGLTSLQIGIPAGEAIEPIRPEDIPGLPVVFYGTSITQGACASRPGMAGVSILCRQLDVPFVNLGFSGSGKMEIELADLLVELDARLFVLDNLANMNADLIAQRFVPFVQRLHAGRPDVPIVVIEDTCFKNTCPTEKGAAVRLLVKQLQAQDMKDVLTFVPSEGMLGLDWEGVVDDVHHNDLGMWRQAQKLAEVLVKYI